MNQDYLKLISENSREFFSKLENWIAPDVAKLVNDNLSFEEFQKQYNLLKNSAIKKYISSTHTWIKGKSHYLKKYQNWYQSDLECAICKMHATQYEEIWIDIVKVTNLPSRDSHNHYISRTCQEVLIAREKYRKVRKGTKCYQCWTYGCLFKY